MVRFVRILACFGQVVSSIAVNAHDTTWWKPSLGSKWDISLARIPKTSEAKTLNVLIIDLFDVTTAQISNYKTVVDNVICYFSAGSSENWRSDFSLIPKSALGKNLDGWAGERWLDIRNTKVRQIMANRMKLAKSKGCDAVDPDNVDVATNDSGFALTNDDGIDYMKFMADTAHSLGLGLGLKNYVEVVSDLITVVDFAVNESCTANNECNMYKNFTDAGKPVFAIAYTSKKTKPCSNSRKYRIDVIFKDSQLQKQLSQTQRCP